MNSLKCVLVFALILLCSISLVAARDVQRENEMRKYMGICRSTPMMPVYDGRDLETAASADTFCIVWYDFEVMDWQGWTRLDYAAQVDTFFHVDDFLGLESGDFGRLVPIEGDKSLWCGARPGPGDIVCSWSGAPGYGVNWEQICGTGRIEFTGLLSWDFTCVYDTEECCDFIYVEYDAGAGNWVELDRFSGVDTVTAQYDLLLPQAATKLRFRFESDPGWDDQDGKNNTDGALIVDDITVSDIDGLIDYEDFESYDVGEKGALGIWVPSVAEPFGTYSALATGLTDKDPCHENYTTQVMFFEGSANPSGDYPGLFDTPFCAGEGGISGPCQAEFVTSPVIYMTRYSTGCDENQDASIPSSEEESLGGAILGLSFYRDLPYENLVFMSWGFREFDETGCPSQWRARAYFYGSDRTYVENEIDVTDLVSTRPVQFAVGVLDMCQYWYQGPGYCANHTPSPYIDDVRIYRYKTNGPVWTSYTDLFCDTFPEENTGGGDPMEQYCRADSWHDFCAVTCAAPLTSGLDTLDTGEARVYCLVNVHFIGPDGKPDISGSVLEGSHGRYISDDGDWTTLLFEPARNAAGLIEPDRYCVDLNDSLLTRGYMIEYYFKAFDLNGDFSTYPATAEEPGGDRFEFTCLPTLRQVPGVLLVSAGDIDISRTYYEPAFDAVTPAGEPVPDIFDRDALLSMRTSVVDAASVPCQAYRTIIYDCGDISYITGGGQNENINDAQLLVDWAGACDHELGLLVMGDVAAAGATFYSTASYVELLSVLSGVSLVEVSYYELSGGFDANGVVSPLVEGVAGGPFDGLSYYAEGGCPTIGFYDVLERSGPGQYALSYPDHGGQPYYAGIYTDQLNNTGHTLRTIWVGHSFMHLRNSDDGVPVRNEFIKMIFDYFGNGVSPDITGSELPRSYSLEQNFPNPFNPSTRICFAMPERGSVRLNVYDVAGRLVRTVHDGVMEAGHHELVWDGKNDLGRNAASGVYFYRIESGDDFRDVKKMVLLR